VQKVLSIFIPAASAGSLCSVSVGHMRLQVTMPAVCVSRGAVWTVWGGFRSPCRRLCLSEQSYRVNAAFIQRLACDSGHALAGPVSVGHMRLQVTMPAVCVSRGAVVVCGGASGHHAGVATHYSRPVPVHAAQ